MLPHPRETLSRFEEGLPSLLACRLTAKEVLEGLPLTTREEGLVFMIHYHRQKLLELDGGESSARKSLSEGLFRYLDLWERRAKS